MKHKRWIKQSFISTAIITSLGLTACGGGDSTPPPVNTLPNTGTFLDSAVEGLEYSTDTLSGTTNANGEFEYNDGEIVRFSLHGQKIIEAKGYSILTPLDNSLAAHDDYVLNVITLLQTLDSDGDPTNGIKIDPITGTMNVNLNQTTQNFASDTAIIEFIAANSNSPLVTPETAVSHFSDTLTSVNDGYTLDITGKTATSVITADYCVSDFNVGFTYTFRSSDYTFTGIDQINSNNFTNCTAGTSSTSTDTYNSFPDFGLDCGPVCSYKDLNTARTGVDRDGRDYITTIWHAPNTNVVTYTKRITNDPNNLGFTWISKEVITIQ